MHKLKEFITLGTFRTEVKQSIWKGKTSGFATVADGYAPEKTGSEEEQGELFFDLPDATLA